MNGYAASLAFTQWREQDSALVEMFAHNLAEGTAPQSAYEAAFAKRYGFTLADQTALLELIEVAGNDEGLAHLAKGARAVLFSTKRGGTALPTAGFVAQQSAVSAADPRVKAGAIFDVLLGFDGTVFSRVGSGHEPAGPITAFRLQFPEELSDDDQWAALRAAKYLWTRNIRATDPILDMVADSPTSLTFRADPSTSRRTNPKAALANFPDDLAMILSEGSPQRVSNTRYGPAGTRQVTPLRSPLTASVNFWWGA